MKLYDAGLSPNALRVRAVALELGIELELVEVNLWEPAAKREALLPVNPNMKVPVLVDGGFVLWESRAITAYLASLRPEAGLYPADPRRRAIVDQWSYWQAHLQSAMQRVVFERYMKPSFGIGEPDGKAIEGPLQEVAQSLGVLNGHLAGREWVAGDLSLADFAIAATFPYRDVSGVPLDGLPNIARWLARVESRPAWQAAAAPIRAFMAS